MNKLSLFLLLLTVLAGSSVTAQDHQLTQLQRKWVYAALRPGVSWEHIKGSGTYLDGTTINKPRNFSLSAAVDLDNPRMKGFIVRLELTYRAQHFNAVGKVPLSGYYGHHIKFWTLTPEIALLYKTPRLWKLRLMGGAGVGRNYRTVVKAERTFFSGPDIYYTSTAFIEVGRGGWARSICAGILFADRIELNAKFWQSGDISNSTMYEMKSRSKILSVAYRF